MKLLTITVPCYNSQDYMRHCVDTLLPGGDDVEILIVDDGSSDDTASIADELAAAHPGIVRAIHQENRGHGGAVMTGIREAAGMYFKVVDSDDWVDKDAYTSVLNTLRQFSSEEEPVDMLVSNYVYEKQGAVHKKVVSYHHSLPAGRVLTWDKTRHFPRGHYLLMHALIYRTGLLRESGLNLPWHTFYVDNLYAYVPLQRVRRFYYLDVDFYRYFIGRSDQSVNEKVMISRIDQQIRVNLQMMRDVDVKDIENHKLRSYLVNYFEIITAVSSILLFCAGTAEALDKKDMFWKEIAEGDPWLYRKIRYRIMGWSLTKRNIINTKANIGVYRIAQKVFGFN